MKLIQLLIPLSQNGQQFPKQYFEEINRKLTETFGGLTVYSRSPAVGLWKEDEVKTVADDIVIFEVMTDDCDQSFWITYKKSLESKFNQDVIVIRVSDINMI